MCGTGEGMSPFRPFLRLQRTIGTADCHPTKRENTLYRTENGTLPSVEMPKNQGFQRMMEIDDERGAAG